MLLRPRDGLDLEDLAAAELNRRARRLQLLGAVPFLLVGLPAAALGFLVLTALQVLASGTALLVISVLLGGVPAFGTCLLVGLRLAHRAVRTRCGVWIDEIAREHGVARTFLEEVAAAWSFDPKGLGAEAVTPSLAPTSAQVTALTSLTLSSGQHEALALRRRRKRRRRTS